MPDQLSSIQDFICIVRDMDGVEYNNIQATAFLSQPHFSEQGLFPLVYLMDYTRLKYHFLTPAVKSIMGYSIDYFKRGGLPFTFDIYHPDDLVIYSKKIFTQNFSFLKTVPVAFHKDYVFTHNFRLKNRQGAYNTLLQQYSIIRSCSDGTPLLFLCHAVDITHWKESPGIIHRIEKNISINGIFMRELIMEKCYRGRLLAELLSKRETEIVKMLCNGYSSGKIADRLHISVFTVNNHRKHILQKSGCRTTGELIKAAFESGVPVL